MHNDQLSPRQLKQLEGLLKACKNSDLGTPLYYPHLLAAKREKNNFLFYQNHQLIGFLGLFFFYEDACEISVVVHPSYRRQGVARKLLQGARPVISAKSVERLIFSVSASVDVTFLQKMGFSLQGSEYQMIRGVDAVELPSDALVIETAMLDDIEQLLVINQKCFPPDPFLTATEYIRWMDDPAYHLLVARYNGEIIGKALLRQEVHRMTYLSDVAILPEYQKRGFGSELLAKSIQIAIAEGAQALSLDVAIDNVSHAVDLYLRHGFQIDVQHDYWVVSKALLTHVT